MSKEERKKEEQLAEQLSELEDEYDDLLDKIAETYQESLDWIEENVNEALRGMMNASMYEDFRDGLSTMEDVVAEINSLIIIRNNNGADLDHLESLEGKIDELRKKV